MLFVVLAQSPSCVTPCDPTDCSILGLTIFRSLLKFMFIASVMPSSHLILWCPLLLLPSIFPSIRDFFNESFVHIRWPEYWCFSFSISPSSEQWIFRVYLPKDWLVWSPCCSGDSRVFSSTTVWKHQFFPGGSDGKKSACNAGDLH